MVQASQIREHMKVVGSDGRQVGRVDHVIGEEIELTKFGLWSGLKHHMIPLNWVESIDAEEVVHLNRTRATAKSQWRAKH
jgi:hypothetical protein